MAFDLTSALDRAFAPLDTLGRGQIEVARLNRARQEQLADEERRRREWLQDITETERFAREQNSTNFANQQVAAERQFGYQQRLAKESQDANRVLQTKLQAEGSANRLKELKEIEGLKNVDEVERELNRKRIPFDPGLSLKAKRDLLVNTVRERGTNDAITNIDVIRDIQDSIDLRYKSLEANGIDRVQQQKAASALLRDFSAVKDLTDQQKKDLQAFANGNGGKSPDAIASELGRAGILEFKSTAQRRAEAFSTKYVTSLQSFVGKNDVDANRILSGIAQDTEMLKGAIDRLNKDYSSDDVNSQDLYSYAKTKLYTPPTPAVAPVGASKVGLPPAPRAAAPSTFAPSAVFPGPTASSAIRPSEPEIPIGGGEYRGPFSSRSQLRSVNAELAGVENMIDLARAGQKTPYRMPYLVDRANYLSAKKRSYEMALGAQGAQQTFSPQSVAQATAGGQAFRPTGQIAIDALGQRFGVNDFSVNPDEGQQMMRLAIADGHTQADIEATQEAAKAGYEEAIRIILSYRDRVRSGTNGGFQGQSRPQVALPQEVSPEYQFSPQ